MLRPRPGAGAPGLVAWRSSAVGMNRIPGLSAKVVTGSECHVRVPGHLLRHGVVQAGWRGVTSCAASPPSCDTSRQTRPRGGR